MRASMHSGGGRRGFRTDLTGVAMQEGNEPGYIMVACMCSTTGVKVRSRRGSEKIVLFGPYGRADAFSQAQMAATFCEVAQLQRLIGCAKPQIQVAVSRL